MKTDSENIIITKSFEQQILQFEAENKNQGRRVLHASGIAHKYADPSKIPLEENAWAEAVAEKYALDNHSTRN